LLRETLQLVKPSVFLATQEPDASAWACSSPGWDGLKSAMLPSFEASGDDFDARAQTLDFRATRE
jgi:hypothetical protein